MKNLRLLSVLSAVLLLLTGCGNSNNDRPKSDFERWMQLNDKIKVLSTTAMIDDIVGRVGGERIDHLSLIKGEIDPHSYELVKGDDEKLATAQLIFYNGLGLEHGASLRYQLQHHQNAVALGNFVQSKYPQEMILVESQVDPHIWMDISMWSEIVEPIVDALIKLDPEGQEFYKANSEIVHHQMMQEHDQIYHELQQIPSEKRFLVTSHDAFNYFTRAYLATPEERKSEGWRIRFAAPEGLAPDGQLSAANIQAIVDFLTRYHIRVVFPESNVSRDSLRKIRHACLQNGLEITISKDPLYGDAVGEEGSGADNYLKMIHHDADVLIRAWK